MVLNFSKISMVTGLKILDSFLWHSSVHGNGTENSQMSINYSFYYNKIFPLNACEMSCAATQIRKVKFSLSTVMLAYEV